MFTLSATCLAIALADKAGTLRITEEEGRFGPFYAISDDRGLIEVHLDRAEVNARLSAIRSRVA
jgi:hypothetical protein